MPAYTGNGYDSSRPKSLPKSRMPNAIFDIDPPTTITNITRNWVKNAYYINDKGKMIKPYENLP